MEQARPVNMVGEVSRAHYGHHYFVSTDLELKGRGIKMTDISHTDRYSFTYKVTDRAMDILKAKHDFAQELLLD
jgi:hypothetical protein